MIRRVAGWVAALLVLGLLAGGCSDDGRVEVEISAAALKAPGLTPVPNGWQGSVVDLMLADAMASCNHRPKDKHADATWAHVLGAVCPGYNPVGFGLATWRTQRADETCNTDPQTGEPADVTLTNFPVAQVVNSTTADGLSSNANTQDAIAYAEAILRDPGANLCIALRLREQAPGTAGGEALLLSAEDQRLLLETTRQRAQMAMLGFAQLGVAFTEPDPGAWKLTGGQHAVAPAEALRIVVKWGRDTSNDTIISGMGGDLAAATQLHAVVVEELFTMYGRSASAREPRGTADAAPGAELWGAGSWRHRALASLYGGDPLAGAADGSTPWKSPTGAKGPGAVPGILYPEAWPTRAEVPYPGTTFAQPEARRLLSLARQVDQLAVYHTTSTLDAACRDINRTKTADLLYRNVEAAVRTETCFETVGGACVPSFAVNLPDPAQNFADFLLYQRFGITPEHADLVSIHLAELLEPVCMSGGTQVFGSGSRNLAAVVTALPPDGYKLSRDATFGERAPLQVQPAFGRYAPLPLSLDVLHDNSPAQQGFRVWPSVPLTGFDDVRRLVGSSAAFAAARAALLVGKSRLGSTPVHLR